MTMEIIFGWSAAVINAKHNALKATSMREFFALAELLPVNVPNSHLVYKYRVEFNLEWVDVHLSVHTQRNYFWNERINATRIVSERSQVALLKLLASAVLNEIKEPPATYLHFSSIWDFEVITRSPYRAKNYWSAKLWRFRHFARYNSIIRGSDWLIAQRAGLNVETVHQNTSFWLVYFGEQALIWRHDWSLIGYWLAILNRRS